MTTSQATSPLSKPSGDDKIPLGTLGYFRARNRHRLYSLVMKEFHASGITQATLARRLDKGTDVICRWLGAPGNWTLDTVSDLLFAISAAETDCAIAYPLDAPVRNFRHQEWTIVTPDAAVDPKALKNREETSSSKKFDVRVLESAQ